MTALHHKKVYRKYNDQCVLYDLRAQCDSSLGLLCLDTGLQGYRCLCPSDKLHSQLFDTKQNACVGKVFNACVRGNSRETVKNDTLCVENSECNTNVYGFPICLCKEGFIEMDDGTCTPALKYGDSCVKNKRAAPKNETTQQSSSSSSSTEASTSTTSGSEEEFKQKCDIKRGHACIEGKCQCKYPSEQYYDEDKQTCISYSGGRCSFERHIYSCVPNANCPAPPPTQPSRQNPLVQPGSFLEGLMQVQDGSEMFTMPVRPRPRPHHYNFPGLPLPPTSHFNHHHPHPPIPPAQLHILTKEDPVLEFERRYDNYDYARSIFFGGSREEQSAKSEFDDENGIEQPKCQCAPGFSRTAQGFCMKDFGSKCHPEDDDVVNFVGKNRIENSTATRELCNPDQFLECLDAHDGSFSCQCRNPLNERYDMETKQCVARIGKRCRPLGNYPKCDKGGECVDGVCRCGSGTSLTPLETCELNHGEKCEPGKCNSWKGLTCHGKSRTCLCLDSYLRYDEGKAACVGGEGGICGSVPLASIFGRYATEIALIGCEQGFQCKVQEIAGKPLASICIREK
ncbi:unnamed protein product [Orchesella dallaii]|uniref:Uncharacterized protein n=1 Tax=Orchesella dallaii TaxID=48710 RepID=A0ABP1QHR3_9HEXA